MILQRPPTHSMVWLVAGFVLCVQLCLVSVPNKAYAESLGLNQWVKDIWSDRDGIPQGSVLSLYEGHHGYLWLGTDCCLVRFDGHNFYTLQEELSHFGQHSFARSIKGDGRKGFWVAFVGGVGHFDGEQFHWFGTEHGLTHPFIYAIEPDLQNTSNLWVGTGGDGIWRLQDGHFVRDSNYQNLPANINQLSYSPGGDLLAATDYGLIQQSAENGSWAHVNDTAAVAKSLTGANGERWIANENGVRFVDASGVPKPIDDVPDEPIYSLIEDSRGHIWAGGENRLYRIKDQRAEALEHALGRTHALLEDRNGNLWVGSSGGLMRLKPGAVQTFAASEGLPQDSILVAVPSPTGDLWLVDAEGGLGLWRQNEYELLAKPGTIKGSGMLGAAVDTEGLLWLANGSIKRWTGSHHQEFWLPKRSAALVESVEEGLWIAQTQADGASSVHFVERESLAPEKLQEALNTNRALSLPSSIRHVQRLKIIGDKLWIATGGTGLLKHNLKNGQTHRFEQKDGLPSDYAYSMEEDSEGYLWVATRSGLARVGKNQIDDLSKIPGMPTRSPVHLYLDEKDRLWITADDGIYVVNRKSVTQYLENPDTQVLSRTLTTRDGLKSLVVSWRRNGQAISQNGNIFYATTDGLSRIQHEQIEFGATPKRINIDRVKLGDKLIHQVPITIANRQEHLEIHFSIPDLNHAHRLEFRSRLIREGREKDSPWSSANTNRHVQFSNLANGKYRFEVNARFEGEAWHSTVTPLEIYVVPRLYEKLWVQMLSAFVALCLLLYWVRHRLKLAEKVEEDLRERVNERTSELSREVEYRKVAEKAAADLAADLEVRVQERTAELELAKMATRRSEERFALAVKGAEDGIWDWDITLNRLYLSPRWLHIIGYSSNEFSINIDHWLNAVHPDDVERLRDTFVFRNRNPSFRIEYRMQHKRGHYVWVLTRGVLVSDEEGAPIRAAGSQTDISARKAVEEQLLRRQMVDVVTGLPNRSLFTDRLEQSLLKGRGKPTMIAVIFLDVDQFRAINEQHGHSVGDSVLQQSAERIKTCLRTEDSVARVGNDEFAILIHNVVDAADAEQAAERICKAFSEPFVISEKLINVSCSMGIKFGRSEDVKLQDFLVDSELALNHAKSSGAAGLVRFDEEMEQETKARRTLESELKQGLEANEFILFYQPLINPKTNQIVGFEALSRWQHPTRGLLTPYHFIGMLEACGLIVPFSQWVLKTGCEQARIWRDKYQRSISISINVPAHQLNDSKLVHEVKNALEKEGLSPQALCLEIVENSLMESQPIVIENLKALRDYGVKIAIDDFGTGYSSFSYLEQFPVDRVKIDRSFCKSVPENPKVNAILSALLKMINQLELEPVVEGVETIAQRDYLLTQSAPNIQGYFYSKPVSADDCEALIEKGIDPINKTL